MQDTDNIPEAHIYYIEAILFFTHSISAVDAKKKSLQQYLRREYLRKLTDGCQEEYIEALTWAIEHPQVSYRTLQPGIEFSNEACVKLFQIFLDHIRLVNDDGPDIVVDDGEPIKVIPYDQWKPS